MVYERIHKRSVYNTPAPKPAGIPQRSVKGDRLLVNVNHVQARSFDCDPRQLAFTGSHGNEEHLSTRKISKSPEMFFDSIGAKGQKKPAWVVGRFNGQPGKPMGPVAWSLIKKVPSLAGGALAWLSSQVGLERGMGNIVSCRGDGKDVIATHISEGADRQLIILNPDGSDKLPEARRQLIADLKKIMVTEIERTELSDDGQTLTLVSKLLDLNGQNVRYDLKVGCLKLDPKSIYRNPGDKKYSIKVIVPDERTDANVLERGLITTFFNPQFQETESAKIQGHRDENGVYHISIKPNDGSATVELTGKSLREIKRQAAYISLGHSERWAVKQVTYKLDETDNCEWPRIKKQEQRYVLQFFTPRETRFKDVLEKPLATGESVVVTKVLASAEVVHLDEANGRSRGDVEIVPLNFEVPKDLGAVRLDPRPNAIYATRFIDPTGTSIAPQHLIDPYVMGTENMAAIWPKIDQLGFFGPLMTSFMAFPFGGQFVDPSKNPWFVRYFGNISHSIFDAKADAGRQYYLLTGSPKMSKMVVGAAMVTGPNTDSVNPAREGRMFHVRMPGMPPHKIKTAMPGFYILVIEDAEASYLEMTMFGQKTETTILPMSAGGGLDNYQLALLVQRSQRWNAGKDIYLMDAAGEMAIDLIRGNPLYRFAYNATHGLFLAEEKEVSLVTSARRDSIGAAQRTSSEKEVRKAHAFDPARPVTRKYLLNEAREWLNVGTWYWVSFQKIALYLSVPAMILLGMLPIPVAGSMFLVGCLGATLFAWPLWAIQMMKVGVNPKGIISLTPIHIFWPDMPMRTMFKSGLDIERMGVGKFRISERSLGNRMSAKDKRFAFWVAAVLPTVGGFSLTAGAVALSLAAGIVPLLLAAAPFVVGLGGSALLSRIVNHRLPNKNSKSFWRSAARLAAGSLPLAAGIAVSAIVFQSVAVFAIPLITAIMAGGWSIFMGLNIRHAFKRYFKEQREVSQNAEPSPIPANIPAHEADTPRNLLREAIGKEVPVFTVEEFTAVDDLDIDPYKLWAEISHCVPDLLDNPGGNPINNLNSLVAGEGARLVDLHREFSSIRPTLKDSFRVEGQRWNPLSYLHIIVRHRKIARLAKATDADRAAIFAKQRAARKVNVLRAEQYDRIKELNRLMIEECFPINTPEKDV